MWSKIIELFGKTEPRDTPPSPREILDEISNLKKSLRKQTAFLDLFRKEVVKMLEEKKVMEVRHFIDLSEAFFYHDLCIREIFDISSNQLEALEIVWQKLEALLNSVGIEIVRNVDVHFDPRLHEAMEKLPEGNGRSVVKKILQPGFICERRVVKPAKVIIEREN